MTLERGTLYRIRWEFPNGAPGGQFLGEYRHETPEGQAFYQRSRKRYLTLKHGKRVVDATPVDARSQIGSLSLYDRVTVTKYGNPYTGTIVGKARTRVCVTYRLSNGQDRTHWFPVLDVEPKA